MMREGVPVFVMILNKHVCVCVCGRWCKYAVVTTLKGGVSSAAMCMASQVAQWNPRRPTRWQTTSRWSAWYRKMCTETGTREYKLNGNRQATAVSQPMQPKGNCSHISRQQDLINRRLSTWMHMAHCFIIALSLTFGRSAQTGEQQLFHSRRSQRETDHVRVGAIKIGDYGLPLWRSMSTPRSALWSPPPLSHSRSRSVGMCPARRISLSPLLSYSSVGPKHTRPQKCRGPKRTQARHQPQPSVRSATPAMKNESRCRQVPRRPRQTQVHVAKCHACHAKRKSMSPSATPATPNASPCCHACHAKVPRRPKRPSGPKRSTRPSPVPYVPRRKTKVERCEWKMVCDNAKRRWMSPSGSFVWKMVCDKDCVWKMVCDKNGVWQRCVWKMVWDKGVCVCVKDGVRQRRVWKVVWDKGVCVCVKDGVRQRRVWKVVCDKDVCEKNGVWQRCVWKMVCDKVVCEKMVCERWCVTKMCVKKLYVKGWCAKDGAWQRGRGGGRGVRGRGGGR